MKIINYKNTIGLSLNLTIELTKSSLPLLKQVQLYFGCGQIYFNDKRNTCTYYVQGSSLLFHKILPHFLDFPLFGSKFKSFYTFLQVLILIYPLKGRNPDKLTLARALYIGWHINEHTSTRKDKDLFIYLKKLIPSLDLDLDPTAYSTSLEVDRIKKTVFNNLNIENYMNLDINVKYLHPLKTINPYFLLGIIEGDGSFYAGLRNNGKIRFGFNITTSVDELMLLYYIKFYLCCGSVKVKGKN